MSTQPLHCPYSHIRRPAQLAGHTVASILILVGVIRHNATVKVTDVYGGQRSHVRG